MFYNNDQHNDNDDHYYHHQQHVPIEGQRVLMALVVRHKLYLQHYVMIIIMFNKGRRRRSRGRNCRNALLMTLCTEQLSRFRSAFLLLLTRISADAVLLLCCSSIAGHASFSHILFFILPSNTEWNGELSRRRGTENYNINAKLLNSYFT